LARTEEKSIILFFMFPLILTCLFCVLLLWLRR
jgi:hypothetical protein